MTDEIEIKVRNDGKPLGSFPINMTPGEIHRLREIDAIHSILSGINAPTVIDNKVLTASERVQWLADKYNRFEGRFICAACNEVWED